MRRYVLRDVGLWIIVANAVVGTLAVWVFDSPGVLWLTVAFGWGMIVGARVGHSRAMRAWRRSTGELREKLRASNLNEIELLRELVQPTIVDALDLPDQDERRKHAEDLLKSLDDAEKELREA